MRQYVRERKAARGQGGQEVFIAQSYQWAQEGQVDWCEAWATLDGQERKVHVFCMRSMASGGSDTAWPKRACRPERNVEVAYDYECY